MFTKFFQLRPDVARQKWPYLGGVAALLAVYFLTAELQPGWLSWFFQLPAAVILAITSLARVNDIKGMSKRWQVRRLGLIFVGIGSIAIGSSPFLGPYALFPTWLSVLMFWGFALTWLTTPHMPPWWKYVSGEYKINKKGVTLPEEDINDLSD